MDEIVFIKSEDMQEELGASGYTLGNQIFLNSKFVAFFTDAADMPSDLDVLIVHELFHCLTRAFPTFKTDMYKIINFTTVDEAFALADNFSYAICYDLYADRGIEFETPSILQSIIAKRKLHRIT